MSYFKGKSADEIRKYSLEKVKAAEGKPSYPPRKRFDSPEDLLQRTVPKLAKLMRSV
ncbi:MAG: hypothetical protein ACI35O_04085 [Bacillaceae bacterium]